MLFGSQDYSRQTLAALVATSTGVVFEPHDSSYWGAYERGAWNGIELKVLENLADHDGELLEPDFEQFPALVLIDAPDHPPAELVDAVCRIHGLQKLRE
jgi:hypothetical protein